ncbi:Na+/H+ antiporter [Streptomyces sp. KLOTTS4A1]|uniref:Na+/H+ antiporter n=1 Tax=Streptomyces sp. KLOTTS4A1 TaxID=3390996 RepID=UPI0039F59D1B
MRDLLFAVAVVAAVAAGNLLAGRWRIAPPVVLVAAGIALGAVPALRQVDLPPEAVLLLFLPALLFYESLTVSLREIRKDLRAIVLAATVLVLLTAAAVAVVAHALGLPWGVSWVLGGALAPTDATAVGVVARLLPRRDVTVLRAESLINDGTALVVYGLAVAVTVGSDHLGAWHVTGLFALSYAGGAAAGALVGWLTYLSCRRLNDPLIDNTVTLVCPFAAYLLAEAIDASGVLAVVVAGLMAGQLAPRAEQPAARLMRRQYGELTSYLLNGALFVLVGQELWSAAGDLPGTALPIALATIAALTGTLIAVRYAFLYATAGLAHLFHADRDILGLRSRTVMGLAGFRGGVSLAAALAVPQTIGSGAAFPDRTAVNFVTTGVVLATLVGQGLVLPALARRAGPPQDEGAAAEHHLAATTTAQAALSALPGTATALGTDPAVIARLRQEYEQHVSALHARHHGVADDPALRRHTHEAALRLALLEKQRAAVLELRDTGRIGDDDLQRQLAHLDHEQLRLTEGR